ncbi:membrane protease YdiL (CAAX protease family) [Streptosporangium becharense]|uniref:Membrane protease YdiL (CAAX protease family) n=1 Tax=Streptosporangium becharense TaxID=1816182 RepID=A0A7W9ID20_9ACTN|nr:CPBP family intramembrane glutamic endopeptidase [Streptosporangium becharense]MBB2911916.1 membrane protease YdiL (CAAX protease family) [Streptosporangium becharense]MBB5818463.1 membrane protease YdiL (CAAX protease family) [Streptosporangium becharense]
MSRRPAELWLFLLVAFGLSWLFALPVWLADHPLGSPTLTLAALAMMFTPALGVLAVWLSGRRRGEPGTTWREWARSTGLTLGERRGRTVALVAVAWLGTPVLVIAAIALSAALGVLSVDLQGLSLFRRSLEAASGGQAISLDPWALVAAQVASAFLIAPLINTIAAFGEEWGWRGWLLPWLAPLGTWKALLVSGLIWGLWHFPLTLRGYNYPELGAWAAPTFMIFCVAFGALLGWSRLRSGSVWPAAIGHGSLNGSAALVLLVGDAAEPPSLVVAGITGLVGCVLVTAVTVVLFRIKPVGRPVSQEV